MNNLTLRDILLSFVTAWIRRVHLQVIKEEWCAGRYAIKIYCFRYCNGENPVCFLNSLEKEE